MRAGWRGGGRSCEVKRLGGRILSLEMAMLEGLGVSGLGFGVLGV